MGLELPLIRCIVQIPGPNTADAVGPRVPPDKTQPAREGASEGEGRARCDQLRGAAPRCSAQRLAREVLDLGYPCDYRLGREYGHGRDGIGRRMYPSCDPETIWDLPMCPWGPSTVKARRENRMKI